VGNAFAPSIESLMALEPDLVLTLEHEQFNSELDSLGITYFVWSPEDIDGIMANIEVVGAITDTIEEAEALAESMEAVIADVEERVEGAASPSVFFIVCPGRRGRTRLSTP